MKRTVIATVVALLATSLSGLVAPAASAHAAGWVDTGKPCNWKTYKSHYKVKVKSKAPVLTHVRTHSMPPGGQRTETRTASRSRTLTASVSYNSSSKLEVSGPKKVIASASAQVDFGLAASGSMTSKKSRKVTATISNRTKKNKAFVFFAGQTRVNGTFRHYFCEQYDDRSDPWTVVYNPGKWRSYGVFGDGAVRCGAGHQTSLEKLALKVGCA